MKVFKATILLLLLAACSAKMVYMTELFRHGARYPVSDIYDGNQTKAYHGLLTGIGMRQHYLLGSYLRKDYLTQLGLEEVFDEKQVEVFTTGSLRCVESAYAHMAGWFPLGSGGDIPAGLDPSFLEPPFGQSSSNLNQADTVSEPGTTQGYQPIPIAMGNQYFPACPNQNKIM